MVENKSIAATVGEVRAEDVENDDDDGSSENGTAEEPSVNGCASAWLLDPILRAEKFGMCVLLIDPSCCFCLSFIF